MNQTTFDAPSARTKSAFPEICYYNDEVLLEEGYGSFWLKRSLDPYVDRPSKRRRIEAQSSPDPEANVGGGSEAQGVKRREDDANTYRCSGYINSGLRRCGKTVRGGTNCRHHPGGDFPDFLYIQRDVKRSV